MVENKIIKEIMKRDDFDSEKIKNRKCNKLLLESMLLGILWYR